MTEFWEAAFAEKQLMWGWEPTLSAVYARDLFARSGAKRVLIPGIGYGRNAKTFLEREMTVTGIEISATAVALARAHFGLEVTIHHGSVGDMPFDDQLYDGIFSFGLIYLLSPTARAKLIEDCYRQLSAGGHMIFTVISKEAPMYGQGPKLGDDCYERLPGLPMFFYDDDSVRREFGGSGLVESFRTVEPTGGGFPFINVVCAKP